MVKSSSQKNNSKGNSKPTKPLFKTKKSTKSLINDEDKTYSNSIYYDAKNFEKVSKHIIDSKLLNQSTTNDTINSTITESINNTLNSNIKPNKTNNLDKTNYLNNKSKKLKNKHTKKMIALSIIKTNINGKKTEKTTILINNGKTIKKYRKINKD